jgi:hypothetical protein
MQINPSDLKQQGLCQTRLSRGLAVLNSALKALGIELHFSPPPQGSAKPIPEDFRVKISAEVSAW